MYLVETTVAGVAQFSAGAAAVTFLEEVDLTDLADNYSARILGYSYNSLGTAHTVSLTLAPAAGGAGNLVIPMETPAGSVSSFVGMFGKDGLVVPRDQTTKIPFVALFSTVGKDDDATFRLWYSIGDVDE